MRLSTLINDSLAVTLSNRSLWIFGFFAAAGGGASASINDDSQGHEAVIGAANDTAQELPAAIHGLVTFAETAGEAVAANLPLVLGGAAALGLGMTALHILSEGALIEGVSRLHREPRADFGLRRGLRMGLDHFGVVLRIKAMALALGLLLATVVAGPFVLAALGALPTAAALALGLPLAVVAVLLFLLDTPLDAQPAWLAGCLYTRVPALTPRGHFVLLIPSP